MFPAASANSSILQNKQITVTVTNTAVGFPDTLLVGNAYVQALPGNTGLIYVGGINTVVNGNVTSQPLTSANGYPLSPGQSVEISVDNANVIFITSATVSNGAALLGA